MKPWRKRVLAAAIGVCLATCAFPIFVLTMVLITVYAQTMQAHGVGHVWVPDLPLDPACPRFQDGLHVTSDVEDRVEPLRRADSGRWGIDALAEFGSWAEKRRVTFDGSTLGGRIHASYDTDYGFYVGSIGGESKAHLHDDTLCFDLIVVRGDGSNRRERWQGEMKLPREDSD